MDYSKYLKEIQAKIGGEVKEEKDLLDREDVISGLPRLLTNYKGSFVKFDFISSGELLIEVNPTQPPPHHMILRSEGAVSKIFDKLHISAEVKINEEKFDKKYRIQNVSLKNAQKTINKEFRKILAKLEPFSLFELTATGYKVHKYVDIDDDYNVITAIEDVDTLIEIARLTNVIWQVET